MLLCFLAGFPFFFFFLLLPLVPLFGNKTRKIRRCPLCGWQTVGTEKFCPYDGNALEEDPEVR